MSQLTDSIKLAAALLLCAAAAQAKTPSDKQLEGKAICWSGHGKAEFHADHSYAMTTRGGPPKVGRWAMLEDGTLSIALKGGENLYVKLDLKGSKVTMLDGDKWSGRLCR